MKIKREVLLSSLEMVKAGLSPREFIEQSSCFVLQEGEVMTFNDEIACRVPVEGIDGIIGAVQASSLLEILGKLKDDEELRVRENDNGELEFRGALEGFGIPKDSEVFLPIERVESPKAWYPIPDGLIEAIKLVQRCVSSDESRFMLTCIHIHPDYVEACDNMQIMRCRINTGVEKPVLVRGSSLEPMTMLGMTKMAQTKSWIHFSNKKKLVFSCRQYTEKYPDLSELIKFKGVPIVLPKAVADVTDRASVFAADRAGDPLISVKLSNGKIRIGGRGYGGWYKGVRDVDYEGPTVRFLINPALLLHICESYSSAQITEEKLRAVGKESDKYPWIYVTALGPPEEEEEDVTVQKKTAKKKKRFKDEPEEPTDDEESEGNDD